MSSLPKSYQAVVLPSPNEPFDLQTVPLRPPSPTEVLVKVEACGVCFTDVAISAGRLGTDIFPRTPGHEVVGHIVQTGSAVPPDRLRPGQRVGAAWHGGHDARCRPCQRGRFQMCDARAVTGCTRDGGYAQYVLVRQEAVVRMPAEVQGRDAAEIAPLLCAGVTVFNGIRKMHMEQGALVAVQGLGGLGHLAVQYAHHMGYEVAVLSSGDEKAAFAKQLGARHYINTRAGDAAAGLASLGGADLIVQTAPSPDAVSCLIGGLAPAGKLLCLAAVGPVEVDTRLMVSKGLSVHGWPSGHALDCEEAIRFAATHGIECMVERYPLAHVQKAVESLLAGKPRFRNVLTM